MALRLFGAPAAVLLALLIALAAGYPSASTWVILWMGAAKASEALSDVYQGRLQRYERLDLNAISNASRGIVGLAALSVGLHVTGSLAWGVGAMASAWLALLLLYDVPFARRAGGVTATLKPRFSGAALRGLAQLGLPLAFAGMLNALVVHTPRYVIERELGEHELGIYSAVAYVLVAGNIVVAALGQSASPRLASLFTGGNKQAFTRLLLQLLAAVVLVGTLASGAGLLIGGPILALLYGEAFGAHQALLSLLILGFAMSAVASILGYAMTSMRLLWVQMVALLTSAGAVLWCSLLWVSDGIEGAAWAYLAGMAAQVAVLAVIVVCKLWQSPSPPDQLNCSV